MELQGSAFAMLEANKEHVSKFARRSYIPSWMEDKSWVQSVELPQDYLAELTTEELNGSLLSVSTSHSLLTTRTTKRDVGTTLEETARRTMALWDDEQSKSNVESSRERLLSLLSDAIKAVTQRTPWDPEDCGTETRKAMLAVLIKKFLDQSIDPGAAGLFAKDVLRRASETDVAQELQYLYITFTHDKTWDGEDPYRRVGNFRRRQDYDTFQERCLEEVRRRLHMLNVSLSGKNINITHATIAWEEIHGERRGECFGGSITLSLISLRLRAAKGSKSDSNLKHKGRGLPKRLTAIWTLRQDDNFSCSAAVPAKCFLRDGEYVWQTGNRVALIVPQGASNHFKDYTIHLELMESRESCFCFNQREKLIASAIITVDDALYMSVAEPNSTVRSSAVCILNGTLSGNGNNRNEPFNSRCEEVFGYHLSSVLLSSNAATNSVMYPWLIDSAKVLCSMCCLNEGHNTRPPAISIHEQNTPPPNSSLVTTGHHPWRKDHHGSFLRLVDVLGDIDDLGVGILRAYCRRYLIHGELEDVALLVSVCTRCNLADQTSRELCVHALTSLVRLHNNLTTHVAEHLVREALETTRSHIFDIILALEDISSFSTSSLDSSEAIKVLAELNNLLLIIDEKIDVNDAVSHEVQRNTKPLVDALERLDGRILREHRRDTVRETLADLSLPDLERYADRERLVGKTRYLLELVTRVMERCRRAFTFATSTQSTAIRRIATCRIETIAHAICVPLRDVVTRILACLVRAPEPDPLGSTLGLLVLTYDSVKGLMNLLEAEPETASAYRELASCFIDFLSCWFPLCKGNISTWMTSIVTDEALEPIIRGTVHFNQSPGLLQDLLQALLSVFLRIVAWTDPSQHTMYTAHFFNLVQTMGETFVDTVVAQGRATPQMEEWLVCLSNLQRYQKVVREFWEKDIATRLIEFLGDSEQVIEHQRKMYSELTRASTLKTEDEFVQHIVHAMELSMFSFISDLINMDTFNEQFSPTFSELRHTADRTANYVGKQLEIAKKNLDDELFTVFLNEIAIRTFYGAFQGLLLRDGRRPLSKTNVALILQLLQTIGQEVELVGGDMLQMELHSSRQQDVRLLTALMGESSEALVQLTHREDLDSVEQKQVMLVLGSRTDSAARHFVKMSSSK